MGDSHLQLIGGDHGIPFEGVQHGQGEVTVAAFRRCMQLDFNFIGDRVYATYTKGRILSRLPGQITLADRGENKQRPPAERLQQGVLRFNHYHRDRDDERCHERRA